MTFGKFSESVEICRISDNNLRSAKLSLPIRSLENPINSCNWSLQISARHRQQFGKLMKSLHTNSRLLLKILHYRSFTDSANIVDMINLEARLDYHIDLENADKCLLLRILVLTQSRAVSLNLHTW